MRLLNAYRVVQMQLLLTRRDRGVNINILKFKAQRYKVKSVINRLNNLIRYRNKFNKINMSQLLIYNQLINKRVVIIS